MIGPQSLSLSFLRVPNWHRGRNPALGWSCLDGNSLRFRRRGSRLSGTSAQWHSRGDRQKGDQASSGVDCYGRSEHSDIHNSLHQEQATEGLHAPRNLVNSAGLYALSVLTCQQITKVMAAPRKLLPLPWQFSIARHRSAQAECLLIAHSYRDLD